MGRPSVLVNCPQSRLTKQQRFQRWAHDRQGCRSWVSGPEGLIHSASEISLDKLAIDRRQRDEVRDRHVLVHLVRGGVAQADLDHGAEVLDEARIRGAAVGGERRLARR